MTPSQQEYFLRRRLLAHRVDPEPGAVPAPHSIGEHNWADLDAEHDWDMTFKPGHNHMVRHLPEASDYGN